MAQEVQLSPFMRKLSPEIRNMIYEFALITPGMVAIRDEQQPGLTRTCREIRGECISMFYYHNTFSFTTRSGGDDGLDDLIRWPRCIGTRHSAMIRYLSIEIGVSNGLMINTRVAHTPWVTLFSEMRVAGCSSTIGVTAGMYDKEEVNDHMLVAPPRRGANIEQAKSFVHWTLKRYLNHLATEHLGRPEDVVHQAASKLEFDIIRYCQHELCCYDACLWQ